MVEGSGSLMGVSVRRQAWAEVSRARGEVSRARADVSRARGVVPRARGVVSRAVGMLLVVTVLRVVDAEGKWSLIHTSQHTYTPLTHSVLTHTLIHLCTYRICTAVYISIYKLK